MHVLGSHCCTFNSRATSHVTLETSQPSATSDANLMQPSPDEKWKNAVVFRPLPAQTDTASVSSAGQQRQQTVVTDVIEQILELAEPVSIDNHQSQQSGQPLNIAVGINRDILQQALENSGLSSIPVAPLPGDPSQGKTTIQDIECISGHQIDCNDQGPALEPEDQDKGEKPEKRIFKKKSTFAQVREESGVRWHVCTYCEKEFKKPSDLVRHIRIHTHEKPFKCMQCFRAFAVKSTLTAHIKTHTGIKAFKCEFCMKCFSTSGSLKVHIRLHTGVRPFACPHCDKKFRTSGHRKTHIASHFKQCELRKLRQQRKPGKVRTGKTNVPVSEIPLQEPILITDLVSTYTSDKNLRDRHIKTLSWAAQSPDLNPIENLWNVIKRMMESHKPSKKELLTFLCQKQCESLVASSSPFHGTVSFSRVTLLIAIRMKLIDPTNVTTVIEHIRSPVTSNSTSGLILVRSPLNVLNVEEALHHLAF
ncbi:unnamed protein product [Ranitomeya imitator]|uniref:C2H2-type domain-containing protein n=1 Tax=Ranitomeya imitator TaxID=111125 RepID=A0ABN9LTQ3_9NEOB|nr:unnamed protein product [Ranitomeya imitator]